MNKQTLLKIGTAALVAAPLLASLAFSAMPQLAGAQAVNFNSNSQTFVQQSGNPIDQLFGILRTIANYFLTAVIVVATFMVIYAGYTYLTAGGDEGKVGTAKNTIIYAVVGVGVALLAQLIVAVAGAIAGAK